jgi:hypothetical protein
MKVLGQTSRVSSSHKTKKNANNNNNNNNNNILNCKWAVARLWWL